MEVGPTTHYVMGGIRVDAETGATHGRRACSPPARSRAGCTARTGSGGNSLSDLLVFGARTGAAAAAPLPRHAATPYLDPVQVQEAAVASSAAPLERDRGRGPVRHPARPAGA